ncbi:DUF4190 domain-containing protein [Nanoarchaeota archaeon]
MIFSCLFFLPFFSLVGLILGIVSLVKIGKNPGMGGKTMAIIAVVIGGILTFFGLFFWLGMFAGITRAVFAGAAAAP